MKNAIITGAASGLGRALAVRLAREGWRIAVCDVNDAASQETARLVEQAGGQARVEHLDVTQIVQWQELSRRLRADWQQLDLLVNNAGVAGAGDVGDYSLDDWHWIMNVNLWNGIYGCHTFVDWLKANPAGAHIINTASLAAIGSAPSMGAYNVTKAGMLALSETLYVELMPYNVGVTVLCPAFFATNLLNDGRFRHDNMKQLAQREFKRAKFTADDVAEAAVRAMHRKQFYVVMPAQGRFYWYFKRLMPATFLRKIGQQFSERVAKS
ncbi:MAG: SDR family NAD(P)-dependent oxidoreductase [Pirellulales bacterium]|nr:SDR family NAD(P)-dependent oxidoreductase [Pirellulales bacterium]